MRALLQNRTCLPPPPATALLLPPQLSLGSSPDNKTIVQCSTMTTSGLLFTLLLAQLFSDVRSNICARTHESENRTLSQWTYNSIKVFARRSTEDESAQIRAQKLSRFTRQTSAGQAYRMIMLESFNIKTNKTCKNKLAEPGWPTPNSEERFLSEREWTKNYASEECGAKLVRASQTMKNPSHLISRNADEYMLYQCRQPTFFVIELCETIRVIRFELDNKELYSGTPRNFTVRTGDHYSTDPQHWNIVGGFEASSNKMETQNFEELKVKTFGKFIRVDINSFHGNEHFCTLTSFRVFGLTEYDYLSMNEDDHEDDNDHNLLTISDDNSKSETYSSRRIRVEINDEMTIYTYQYIFLQTRKDVCLGKFDESRGIEDTNLISADSAKGIKKEKDSVLVGLSNKVRILEKNLTAQGIFLRNLDDSQTQENKELNKLHKTTVKMADSIKTFSKDSETVQHKVSKHDDRIEHLELEMSRFEESVSIAIGICFLLAMVCNLLVLAICCWASINRSKPTEPGKDSIATKAKSVRDSQVQTEPAPPAAPPAAIAKKVSFSDDNNNDNSKTPKDEDISMKLNMRRIVRKDPNRRVTWCPGTFKKLALEAQQLIREI